MCKVNILIFLLSRALGELQNPGNYSLVYLNLMQEESRSERVIPQGPMKAKEVEVKGLRISRLSTAI